MKVWIALLLLFCEWGLAPQYLGSAGHVFASVLPDQPAQGTGQLTHPQRSALSANGTTNLLYSRWTSEQGLPHNSATALCQTRDGYLWIGTGEGLVRFDGLTMTPFNNTNTPGKSHYVNALLEDRLGALWIGTGGGVYRMQNGVFTRFSVDNGLLDDYVYALLEDRNGDVWVGTGGGVNRLHLDKQGKMVCTGYTTKQGLSGNRVYAIVQNREGALFVGTWGGGVSRLAFDQQGNTIWSRISTESGLSSNFVRTLLADADGSLWIGTLEGLNRLQSGKCTAYTTKQGLSNADVLSLLRDSSGVLWIGTNGGGVHRLELASGNAVIEQKAKNEAISKDVIAQESIRAFLMDKEGSLWIGTYSGGLHRLNKGICTNYTTDNGLSNDHVTAVLQDRTGTLYFGTAGGGVNRLQNGVFTTITTKNGLPSNYIQTLLSDREGTLWIGTWGGGLSRLRSSTLTNILPTRDTLRGIMRALLQDGKGALWIGTSAGLSRRDSENDNASLTTYTTQSGLSSADIQTLHLDNTRTGAMWIGTWGGGLQHFFEGKFQNFSTLNSSTKNGLSNNFIRALYQDREGVMWIGTDGGGLNRLKNGVISVISGKNGLFDDGVRCILEDDFGSLWISCNKGIFCIRKEEANAVADGTEKRLTCTVFGSKDGINNVQATGVSPAAWKDAEGCLWFPTKGGIVKIHPHLIHAQAFPPTVLLEEIRTDDEVFPFGGNIANTLPHSTLPHGTQTVQFRYTATSLLASERVQFKVMLEGYDKAWIDVEGRRTVQYTNLPRGREYRFRVIACNSFGVWNKEGASFKIYLAPFFWETWWFMLVCAMTVLAAGYGAYRLRTRQLRLRSEELERVIHDRTATLAEQNILLELANAEKNEFLGIAAHDLKNPLSGIQGTAELLISLGDSFSPEERQQFLTSIYQSSERMFELIKNLLDINAIENGGLNLTPIALNPTTLLRHVIDQYSLRAEKKQIQLHFTAAEHIIKEEIAVFADEPATMQVLENLVSNAVKYSPHKKNIFVRLTTRYDMVRIEVQDEGPGISQEDQQKLFGKFARLTAEPTGGEHSTGLGLSIVKKLVEAMNGKIWCESELGNGACFILELPTSSPGTSEPILNANNHLPPSDGSPQKSENARIQIPNITPFTISFFPRGVTMMRTFLSSVLFFVCVGITTVPALQAQQPSASLGWKALMDSADIFIEKHEYDSALSYALRAVEVMEKRTSQHPDTNYIEALNIITDHYLINLGQVKEAEPYCKKAFALSKDFFKSDHLELAKSTHAMGFFYFKVADFAKAEPLLLESLEMVGRLNKGDDHQKANYINDVGNFYKEQGNFMKAEIFYKEALEMFRRLFKADDADLATVIGNLGSFYFERGEFGKAEPLLIESLTMKRRIFKSDHPSLAVAIQAIGGFYFLYGEYSKAEIYLQEALSMYRRLFTGDNLDLARAINNLAVYYRNRGEFAKAEPLFTEVLAMVRRIFQSDNPAVAIVMYNMASFYESRGKYADAEPLFIEVLAMRRRLHKIDHIELARSLNSLALFFDRGSGRYQEAEQLFVESLAMYRRLFKTDNPDLANSIGNLGAFYHSRGEYAKAELLRMEAMEMYRKVFKNDHSELARAIGNIGGTYFSQGEYAKAEPLFAESLTMFRRINKIDHPDLARAISNMSALYNSRGDYEKAEPLISEGLAMYRRIYDNIAHPDLVLSLTTSARYWNNRGRLAEAGALYAEGLVVNSKILNSYFPSLSEREKQAFWGTMSNYFEQYNSFASGQSTSNAEGLSRMYDNQLATKGLLLNATQKVKMRVSTSGDTALISLLSVWQAQKEQIAKFAQVPKADLEKKRINLDSLENLANATEKEISRRSEAFAAAFNNSRASWREVQTKLKPDEAAVEIVRFRHFGPVPNKFDTAVRVMDYALDSIRYAALILTSKTTSRPELVELPNGNNLEKEWLQRYKANILGGKGTSTATTTDNDSYNAYWKPIAAKLKQLNPKLKTVYLAPDGVYNQINLSTLYNPATKKYVLDELDVRTVTSTKDILQNNKQELAGKALPKTTAPTATLIGFPDFNLDTLNYAKARMEMLALARANSDTRGAAAAPSMAELMAKNTTTVQRGVPEERALAGMKFGTLPGTKTEIEDISGLLKKNAWTTNVFTGREALEEAVKAADNPRVLHIATHGFFLPNAERDTEGKFKAGQNPLLRSGLALAGANRKVDIASSTEEDGILTAYEAMNLNLDKTELVVLSACETGVGEVKNGEGVYGLQRAFKVAGAKSLMMSLWAVSDNATQKLMTEFYRQWMSGKNKRAALKAAQTSLRADARYKSPYYWGAFVLVGE
jgi:signal transduction histidine kinase/ligand-binding sensor domain-containing protein/CHAT domain-containing protein